MRSRLLPISHGDHTWRPARALEKGTPNGFAVLRRGNLVTAGCEPQSEYPLQRSRTATAATACWDAACHELQRLLDLATYVEKMPRGSDYRGLGPDLLEKIQPQLSLFSLQLVEALVLS